LDHLQKHLLLKLINGCSSTLGLYFHKVTLILFSETPIKVSCRYEESAETFKVTGVRTFYAHVFSDTDFLLSEVKNRPQGIWNYDPTSEND
jgi:hypothetical protein